MEPKSIVELLWNIVGVVAVLALSCIVAYKWGHGDGYNRGIEVGKYQMARLMKDTIDELKRVAYGRRNTDTKDKRRHRRSRV